MIDKKGIMQPIVMPLMILGLGIITGSLLVVITMQIDIIEFGGETQLGIMNSLELNERAFAYLDAAANLAVKQAYADIGQTGGFKPDDFEEEEFTTPCGIVVYPLWNEQSKSVSECGPNVGQELARRSSANYRKYLEGFPEVDLSGVSYNFRTNLNEEDGSIDVEITGTQPLDIPVYGSMQHYYDVRRRGTIQTDGVGISGGALVKGFNSGSRFGDEINTIVMHWTAGNTAQGAFNALLSQGLSYHYIIDKDGSIFELVPEIRSAFHAGCANAGTSECRSVNGNSIGISLVDCGENRSGCTTSCIPFDGDERYGAACFTNFTEEQYDASARLISQISGRHPGIDLETSLIGHDESNKGKIDPGPYMNYDYLINRAKELTNARRTDT